MNICVVDFVMLLSSRVQNSDNHQQTASDAEAAGSSHVPQSTDAQTAETLGELWLLSELNIPPGLINRAYTHL